MKKELVKKVVEAYIKRKLNQEISMSPDAGAYLGKYAFMKKKAKNETVVNPRKNSKPNKTGLPSTFVKGTKNNVYTKSYGYKEVKPSDMLDASYLWNESLNEVRYSQFKKAAETRKPADQVHNAMKEILKRVNEINRILEFTDRLRTELKQSNENLTYLKRTSLVLEKMTNEIKMLQSKIKQLTKNG